MDSWSVSVFLGRIMMPFPPSIANIKRARLMAGSGLAVGVKPSGARHRLYVFPKTTGSLRRLPM